MQKRLSIARALLTEPSVLLIDEATHDLDPGAAARMRELVRRLGDEGSAVVWATQRIEEIRGFADGVTLLREGEAAVRGNGLAGDRGRGGRVGGGAAATLPAHSV